MLRATPVPTMHLPTMHLLTMHLLMTMHLLTMHPSRQSRFLLLLTILLKP